MPKNSLADLDLDESLSFDDDLDLEDLGDEGQDEDPQSSTGPPQTSMLTSMKKKSTANLNDN
jgi:hypothetical protein